MSSLFAQLRRVEIIVHAEPALRYGGKYWQEYIERAKVAREQLWEKARRELSPRKYAQLCWAIEKELEQRTWSW